MHVIESEKYRMGANELLRQFQHDLYTVISDQGFDGWDGSDNVTYEAKWTYAGSLLYSVTVITTIGK